MNTRPLEYAVGATVAADLLRTAWRAALRALRVLRHRRQIEELMELDDRLLRDIGITRADVRKALGSPMSKDPSCELAELRSAANRGSLSQCNISMSDSRQPVSRSR